VMRTASVLSWPEPAGVVVMGCSLMASDLLGKLRPTNPGGSSMRPQGTDETLCADLRVTQIGQSLFIAQIAIRINRMFAGDVKTTFASDA